MISEGSTKFTAPTVNPFTAADVAAILRDRRWLAAAIDLAQVFRPGDLGLKGPGPNEAGHIERDLAAWLGEAAVLLGPHATSRDALADLLRLVFEYDARAILRRPESHAVLAREGAREVIRELAHQVLEGPPVDSDRFKEIVSALKERLRHRGRKLFHPIRLALAGRAGEGELDRVILVLDCAAALPSCIVVKGTRQRMLEFCASME